MRLASFDLMEERWLPVIDLDGTPQEVSLAELLKRAHTLRRMVGVTSPMTAALHRLVLALAHRAYGPPDTDHWVELWQEGFAGEKLAEYLSKLSGSFDLFDEDRPFLQCPALAGVNASSPVKLIPYRSAGNNTTLFDHTTSSDEVTLTPAEAARWLVMLHAYDPGGLKTPYTKVRSSQAAPANWFGLVLLEGKNLKETLLLNLMPYNLEREAPQNSTLRDRPAWEADAPAPEPDERRPLGWTDLLTWPSRRVWLGHRLVGDLPVVDRVIITPGTRLKAEPEDHEWMAAYRRRQPKTDGRNRRGKQNPTYGPWYPIRLQEHRGVWLHSRELFLAPVEGEELSHQRPRTLKNVAYMVATGAIPASTVYTLRVFGQQLDRKSSVVEQTLEEAVATPVALLRARYERAGPAIGYSVDLARDVGSALSQMERDFCKELKREPVASLEVGYWPGLSAPFDDFLRALAAALEDAPPMGDSKVEDPPLASRWAADVSRVARQAADRWAAGSPQQGRTLEVIGAHYGKFLGLLKHYADRYLGQMAGHFKESTR